MGSAITSVPGSARACSRAARFGVSPTTAFRRHAILDLVAHDHEAGRDADPHLLSGARSSSAANPELRSKNCQAGVDRPRRVVLMRLRIAEIGKYTIAHVLRDVAPRFRRSAQQA